MSVEVSDREKRWRDTDLSSFSPPAHIHLMGICGTAMASLAGLLKEQGFRVTGSDQNVYPPMSTQLEALGITIQEGYSAENLEPKPDLVIVGNVITRKHEEAQALINSQIPFTSLPKAMGHFAIADRQSVVVTGTHGKTTTTSMMAWMAEVCSREPGFLIGGIPKNFGRSFQSPKGDVFVIEGDEYDTAFFDKVPKFIHYRPRFVILTSVEFDHADIYADLDAVIAAFRRLVDLIPEDGVLVANESSPIIRELARDCRGKVIFYGPASEERTDTIGAIKYEYASTSGELVIRAAHGSSSDSSSLSQDSLEYRTKFPFYGDYNLANATAAFALAIEMGWPQEKLLEALESFSGVKRRQEVIGKPGDITIIEDFAHHPTAVGMTIRAVQKHFADKKVISVFEPRSATSRRKHFQNDYAKAFSEAQKVLLAQPFNQTNIPEDERFSSQELRSQLGDWGVSCELIESTDEMVDRLQEIASAGDVILVMSNGGFDGLYQRLLTRLAEKK